MQGLIVSTSAERADGPLVFLHILKTGGYSICQELFSRTALAQIHNGSPEQYEMLDPSTVSHCSLFVGHFSYRHLKNIPAPGFLFSMVRHPIDRAISSYFFLRHQANLKDAPYLQRQITLAQEYSFADILERESDFDAVSKNHQTKLFFDDWRVQANVDAQTLKSAIDNSATFDLVGIFERYDDSMQMLCARLGWKPWPSGIKLNTTKHRVTVEDLDSHTAKLLCRLNEFDIELYEHLRERFEREFRDLMRRFVRGHALKARQDRIDHLRSPAPTEIDLFADVAMDGEGWHTRELVNGAYARWLGPGDWQPCRSG